MREKTKQALLARIVSLAQNTSDPFTEGARRSRSMMTEGIAFAFIDEYADLFDEVLRTLLLTDQWGDKFSEAYIEKALRRLLARILGDEDYSQAEAYFDALIAELDNYAVEWTAYVPLFGIDMWMDALSLGNITLGQVTAADSDKLVRMVEAATAATKNSSEEREAFIDSERHSIDRHLRGKVCAVYKVVAEPQRAQERAETETRRVLDLLQYGVAALYPKSLRVVVGLQGEVASGIRYAGIFSGNPGGYFGPHSRVGALARLELTPENVEHLAKIGVFAMANVLKKPDNRLTDFERTLLRGLHWFANAQTQVEPENELLNLMTCLETYLTPRDGNPIRTAVAEGTAIIIGTGLENRKRLKRRIQSLYSTRSGVSHGGKKEVLDKDVIELGRIAGYLTMTLIRRKDEFPLQQALLDWIEDRKLGGE